MPTPTDVASVKHLCGMVQYMAKFLPDLANEMEPIRELTRKEVPWNWSNERERAFQNVNGSSDPSVFRYEQGSSLASRQ